MKESSRAMTENSESDKPAAAKMVGRLPPPPRPQAKGWTDLPAWGSSLMFHILLFLVIAWVFKPIARGTNGEGDRPIGIALVHQTASGSEYTLTDGGNPGGSASTVEASTKDESNPMKDGPNIDVDAVLKDLMGSNTGGGDSKGSGEKTGSMGLVGSGDKRSGSGGTGSTTEFFGVKGYGTSFVFVLDRSDSMTDLDSSPLRAAKKELLQSLQSLNAACQFQIIFYNDSPLLYRSPIGKNNGLLFASDAEKQAAMDFVRSTVALGSTEHLAALRQAIRLGPDVIFFLTDADEPRVSSDQMESLISACGGTTTIHSVEFGVGPNPAEGRWIETLAKKTRGTFRYVDVTDLAR